MKKQISHIKTTSCSGRFAAQVSKNTFIYRGFTIRKTPRNVFNPCQTYLVNKYDALTHTDNYYGRDYALSEAFDTVDRIIKHDSFIAA